MGKLDDAKQQLERVFQGQERSFINDFKFTTSRVTELAHCFQQIDRISDAQTLLELVFQKRTSILGSRNNLTISIGC